MVKNIYISVSVYITDSLCCTTNVVNYASMQKKKKGGGFRILEKDISGLENW